MPEQLVELLGLAFGTVAVTGLLRRLASQVDAEVKGYGAVIVSAVVAVALTATSVALGWYEVPVPSFTGNPVEYAGALLEAAGAVTVVANAVYMYVYERVAGDSEPEQPADPMRGTIR